MYARHFVVLVLAISWVHSSAAQEEVGSQWAATTLTGGWSGQRSALLRQGINVELLHKSDVLSNLSGGLRRGTAWLGHTEAGVSFDLAALLGWEASSGYINYHSQLGSKFNGRYVGSFMGVDNIEANTNTAQFSQAWLQKNFADERFSILAGLYQIDSEFYVTDTSGVFIQPPYGISNELAQTGVSGPPVFPVGALGIRLKYLSPQRNFYLQGALTDGVPGNPNNPRGTHIRVGNGDGTLAIVELGYAPQENDSVAPQPGSGVFFNKTAVGMWRYSSSFPSIDPADGLRYLSRGIYVLAERSLLVELNHPQRGMAGFVRFGTANQAIHQADWTGSFGLRYRGLFAQRSDDIAGVAVTVNHAGRKYQQLNASLNSETDVEFVYRAQLTPWFSLQPTLQYIAHPNMDAALQNVWIVGTRMEINL